MKAPIIEQYFKGYSPKEKDLISKAYNIAAEALKEDYRDNKHPFIEHALNVAIIVADEIGLQGECIAASFLHEAISKHPDIDLYQYDFGKEVCTMVEGLNKIATIKPKDTRLEAENYKKLIVQYSTDPRIVVLKIADRLEIMRNLSIFPKLSRERKILETLMLYIPLAHQLGLYNIKSELEDIYFKYAEPEQYRAITNKLKATEKDRERLKNEFIEPLKQRLSNDNINYKLKVRTKTAYSIFRKMQKQKVSFEEVYDVFAIRFIIDCENDNSVEKDLCWKVYSYVTEEYEADTKRLRDWITQPKANGYESLHITVKNKDNLCLEVQIRTKRMDDIAENGHAAHWAYKGISHEASLDTWLKSVRYTLEHPQAIDKEELPQPPSKEIFVFTPTGELRILPVGASVLDFAFNIHSNIGVKCSGAKVNGKVVSIKDKLKTGDVIEIITNKNQRPAPSWINYVVSGKARNKIRLCLSEDEYKKAAEGKELVSRRLKNWKLSFPDDLVAELMKKLKYSSVNSFYANIADGIIDINIIKTFIIEHDKLVQESIEAVKQAEAEYKEENKSWNGGKCLNDDILVINAKDLKCLDYKMAKCCNPVYGDEVFGFVTRTKGITIHRISCPNASRLIHLYPYRIQKVKWAESGSTSSFQCTLKISSIAEPFIINKIIEIINVFKASLRNFNINDNQRNGLYDITMKVLVPSNTELDKIISQIRTLKQVLKISRS